MFDQGKLIMFRNRLEKMFRHRSRQARRMNVSCYRVYDHDLPEFPFCIEFYGEHLYVAEYLRHHGMDDDQHAAWLGESLACIGEVLGVSASHIFLRERKKMSHREGQYEKLDSREHIFTVEENGLRFRVNLTDYLDTGLFLDHRLTRQRVREEAAGKEVLNLFCYTGSFSVYAAAGGAARVTSVDLSNTYLQWAGENLLLNGFKGEDKYPLVQADVKAWLKTLRPRQFDLVIMDPPTFSNSKRMKDFLDIQRDHVELIKDVLLAMKPGGTLYFSTNFSKFQLDKDAIPAADIKEITAATTPFDFEGKLKRWCFRLIR
jgi:23S rRNA (cytosine1962-C5)-methyltransferase